MSRSDSDPEEPDPGEIVVEHRTVIETVADGDDAAAEYARQLLEAVDE